MSTSAFGEYNENPSCYENQTYSNASAYVEEFNWTAQLLRNQTPPFSLSNSSACSGIKVREQLLLGKSNLILKLLGIQTESLSFKGGGTRNRNVGLWKIKLNTLPPGESHITLGWMKHHKIIFMWKTKKKLWGKIPARLCAQRSQCRREERPFARKNKSLARMLGNGCRLACFAVFNTKKRLLKIKILSFLLFQIQKICFFFVFTANRYRVRRYQGFFEGCLGIPAEYIHIGIRIHRTQIHGIFSSWN